MAYKSTTNVSLRKAVRETIGYEDDINVKSAHDANMDILEKAIGGIATSPTGASCPAVNGCRILQLNPRVSSCSIATIVGYIKGMPFTIICMANSSTKFMDAKSKWQLSADWIPQQYDTLTLVWNGTYFIEIGRVNN